MPYAAELYFDHETEAVVRQLWQAITDAGLPSADLTTGVRPHVSLAVYDGDTMPTKDMAQSLSTHASRITPFSIEFPEFGFFPTAEGVVFLGATVTAELLQVHVDFHRAFETFASDLRPYYRVGRWVPHCTLALGASAAECADILPICWPAPLPLQAQVLQIGMVEVSLASSQLLQVCDLLPR